MPRRGGKPKGLPKQKLSEKELRQRRTAGWQDGKRAQVPAISAHHLTVLYKANPGLEERTQAFSRAIAGDYEALDETVVRSMVETQIVRDMVLKAIADRGILLEQPVATTGDGEVVFKTEANPALYHLHKLNETQGFTAKDQLLSKHSRGETYRDVAAARSIEERNERLRRSDKRRFSPEVPALINSSIESAVVPGPGEIPKPS